MKKLTKEEITQKLAEPNGPAALAAMNVDRDALLDTAAAMFAEDGAASALIIRLAANKQYLIKLSENAAFTEALKKHIASDSPKLRRNSARLIGLVKPEGGDELLISALKKEEQRFARGSMVLALGSVGGEKAAEFLNDYRVAPPADETEKKHFAEETEALELALRSLRPAVKHVFTGLSEKRTVELRAPERLTHQLETELEELGFSSFDIRLSSLKTETDDLPALFEARCFSEALFPIGSAAASPAAIAKKAAPFLEEFMASCHTGEPPYRFRTETAISGSGFDRRAFSKAVSSAVENGKLANSPSDYEAELRIEGSEKNVRLYAKLYTFRDERFSYREGSIPASMAPNVAASVLRFAQDHLTVNARVIDPCCGSGTFLIERGLLSPCASLTGVDISHHAVDVARRNTELAGVNAKYTVNDILRFECHRPYDELIANLPFGNRVGDHSSCEKLYRGLLDRLPQLVKNGGVAILYTMEFTLLKRLIRETPHVTLLSQERTEAGGLTPMIFVLRVGR